MSAHMLNNMLDRWAGVWSDNDMQTDQTYTVQTFRGVNFDAVSVTAMPAGSRLTYCVLSADGTMHIISERNMGAVTYN